MLGGRPVGKGNAGISFANHPIHRRVCILGACIEILSVDTAPKVITKGS